MRATSADGTLRGLPDFKARRTAPPTVVTSFAEQLNAQRAPAAPSLAVPRVAARPPARAAAAPRDLPGTRGPERPFSPMKLDGPDLEPARATILARARSLLDVPYVWGGNATSGMDCSAYISRAWGVPRQTTDTLHKVADPVSKDELRAGDALNLPTWKDPSRHGHVRLFDRWADEARTRAWVYEETAETGKSVYRTITWDDRYQPMRLRGLA